MSQSAFPDAGPRRSDRPRVVVGAATSTLRAGLRALLPGAEVVAEVALAQELATAPEADAVVVDGDLLAAALTGTLPWLPVVVVGADDDTVVRLRAAGVPGWAAVPDAVEEVELAAALQAVLAGFVVVSPALVDAVLSPVSDVALTLPATGEPLTGREREVLVLLATGLPNKAIAARLDISENTVKFHLGALYGKLGVSSRAAAVREGVRHGLIVV